MVPMTELSRSVDPTYLAYQYADSEKLRIRTEMHQRFSENTSDWRVRIPQILSPEPGDLLLDIGCGHGAYHQALAGRRVRVIALDRSFGMVREARENGCDLTPPPSFLQGDAEALPLADASCDRVMAVHVLFHVANVAQALLEIRRVLKPGSRALVTTNACDHSTQFWELHDAAAQAQGYEPAERMGSHFTMDHTSLVQSVFPGAERNLWPNALVFRDAEPAIRFYASGQVDTIRNRPVDGSHRPALIQSVGERIRGIIARDGVFRVSTGAGCFILQR